MCIWVYDEFFLEDQDDLDIAHWELSYQVSRKVTYGADDVDASWKKCSLNWLGAKSCFGIFFWQILSRVFESVLLTTTFHWITIINSSVRRGVKYEVYRRKQLLLFVFLLNDDMGLYFGLALGVPNGRYTRKLSLSLWHFLPLCPNAVSTSVCVFVVCVCVCPDPSFRP